MFPFNRKALFPAFAPCLLNNQVETKPVTIFSRLICFLSKSGLNLCDDVREDINSPYNLLKLPQDRNGQVYHFFMPSKSGRNSGFMGIKATKR